MRPRTTRSPSRSKQRLRAHSGRRRRASAPGGGRARAALQRGSHPRRTARPDAAAMWPIACWSRSAPAARSRRTTGSIPRNSVDYPVAVQTPQYRVDSTEALLQHAAPRQRRAAHAAAAHQRGAARARHHAVGRQSLQRAAALRCLRQRAGPRPGLGGRRRADSVLDAVSSRSSRRAASSKCAARWRP